jgi:hypothetical protein
MAREESGVGVAPRVFVESTFLLTNQSRTNHLNHWRALLNSLPGAKLTPISFARGIERHWEERSEQFFADSGSLSVPHLGRLLNPKKCVLDLVPRLGKEVGSSDLNQCKAVSSGDIHQYPIDNANRVI